MLQVIEGWPILHIRTLQDPLRSGACLSIMDEDSTRTQALKLQVHKASVLNLKSMGQCRSRSVHIYIYIYTYTHTNWYSRSTESGEVWGPSRVSGHTSHTHIHTYMYTYTYTDIQTLHVRVQYNMTIYESMCMGSPCAAPLQPWTT